MGADPWRVGARMRYWRTRRGLTTKALGELVGKTGSWVQAAERGERAPYRLDDLMTITKALRVDLGVFLTEPVPGVQATDQQRLFALLETAFASNDPRAGLAALARAAGPVEPGDDDELMLIVEVGGAVRLVRRRELLRTGGALVGISMSGAFGWLSQDGELAGATISLRGVGSLRAIVTEFRRLDDEVGPGPLRAGVASHLRVVESLRGYGKSDEVEQALGQVAGELEQLGGYLAYNAGDRDEAMRSYRRGLATARQVGDDHVAAYTLGWMAVTAGDRRPADAVSHAEAGLAHARRTASHRLQAALCLRSARANAQAGNAAKAAARIDQAREALTQHGEDPPFIYWFDEAELDAQAGGAWVILERPRAAEPLIRSALDRLDNGMVQQAGLRKASLARTLALLGNIPEAAQVGIDACRLYEQCPADWTKRPLRDLAPLLRDSKDPGAVELRERLRSL